MDEHRRGSLRRPGLHGHLCSLLQPDLPDRTSDPDRMGIGPSAVVGPLHRRRDHQVLP